ncbi:MAG: alpha-mannosidase [Fibrobacteres bacterium]|nr:alpha-mannosidase [Fibrobacterota bacterium]
MDSIFTKVQEEYLLKIKLFEDRISKKFVEEYLKFDATYHKTKKHIPLKESFNLEREPISEGTVWGEAWDSGYFKLVSKIPAHWKGRMVAAEIALSSEALIYSDKGVPLAAFSDRSVWEAEYRKELYHLYKSCAGGEDVVLFIEGAANNIQGINQVEDPSRNDENKYGTYSPKIEKMRLVLLDWEHWQLKLEINLLRALAIELPANSPRRAKLIHGLNNAVNSYAKNNNNAAAARKVLKPLLEAKNGSSALTICAVGHAHIDTAWLWRIQESMRKTARTFASQIDLIERYPDYVFGASQPQLYTFIKDQHPELYAKVKAAVKRGQWELQGGMWVEADCNIISGESMVRQMLHGKNFYRDEFGVDVKNLWIPDVFGYSGNLPQIMKRSGVDYFLTQKISWNIFNTFPHHTFMWQGIDGSKILTHFPPEGTYNSMFHPKGMLTVENKFSEKGFLDECMVLFGAGDGGGGPKQELIEKGRRMADLEGVPKIKFGRADEFFERLNEHREELATYKGELYLEMHRGTLTTQAAIKKYNRKFENLLRQIEAVASLLPAEKYPSQKLDKIWKMVLTNQFHDIIPGSSINSVYKDAAEAYENGLKECGEIVSMLEKELTVKNSDALTLFNVTSYPFEGSIKLPDGWKGAVRKDGAEIICQDAGDTVLAFTKIPAHSFVVINKENNAVKSTQKEMLVLENNLIRYTFSKEGRLIEALDKETNTSILTSDRPANTFSIYEDRPSRFDAWEIEFFYTEMKLGEAEIVDSGKVQAGPLYSSIDFTFKTGESEIRQKASLLFNTKRLEFHTFVDWKESHKMLRVAFPTTITADEASYDVQYGTIKRSTKVNNSHEFACFESVGHRYADISNPVYGAALLNDCKYGYMVRDGVLDLNLLRSPSYPDPDADVGLHEFTYAFLPHTGDLVRSNVQVEAEQLNVKPLAMSGETKISALPFKLNGGSVVICAVKKAEKENCTVVRLYETAGINTETVLTANGLLNETDLIEWNDIDKPQDICKGIKLQFTPFAIRTFKFREKG